MEVQPEILLEMYRRMIRIREFELAAMDLFKRGQVKGTVHPYIGQEASGVGVCMALRRDDLISRHTPKPWTQYRQRGRLEENDGGNPWQGDRLLQRAWGIDAHRGLRDR